MKEIMFVILYTIIMTAIIFSAFLYATSPSVWYAGMHDSQHEGDNCKCYERFIEQDSK